MRPRRTQRRTAPPLAQYNHLHRASAGADARLVTLCHDLMKIAADARRHGLTVISIAARPVPRVYAVNPLDAA